MSALYQLSDGSKGTQPDGSGSHPNGGINLSDSEAERSAQHLSVFPGLPESKGQTIHLTGGVFTPHVAAQLPAPPAFNMGGEEKTRYESSTSSQHTDGFIVTGLIVQRIGSADTARRRGGQHCGAYRGGGDLAGSEH